MKPNTTFLTAICLLCIVIDTSQAISPETDIRMQQIYGAWDTVSMETLLNPTNAEALAQLKIKAKNRHESTARLILIRANDRETIQDTLNMYRLDDPSERSNAAKQLFYAGNLKVIPLLAADLNIEESARPKVHVPFTLLPLSVEAASIIRAIISRSGAFTPDLQQWADRLPGTGDEVREPIRAWWKRNRTTVEQGNYQAAVVPSGY